MKVLVTGVSGQDGAHLSRLLWRDYGAEVHAIVRSRSRSTVLSQQEWDRIQKHIGDITDAESVIRVVDEVQPDYVVHLAAISHVPTSWRAPNHVVDVNINGTVNVLEASRRRKGIRVLVAGSSEAYGWVTPRDCPIHEGVPYVPLSTYGVSKAATILLAQQYFRSYNLFTIPAVSFNHFFEGRNEHFAEGSFANQIARIEAGLQDPVIRHGNLEAIRDYTDARDVVAAYMQLLTSNATVPGMPYNIASGKGYKMSEILEKLVSLSNVEVKLETDPERMRPSDVPLLIGDSRRLRSTIDWKPNYSIDESLKGLLDWHRDKVSKG